jgi:hypothetical protein
MVIDPTGIHLHWTFKKRNVTTITGEPVAIPLKLTSIGHLEAEVSIDGIKTKFLIDTGASNTVIDINFAKENFLEFAAISDQGGGLGTSQMSLHHKQVKSFRINDLEIKDFDLYATDFTHVKESLTKKGIEEPSTGVIGADILINYNAVIDYEKKILFLRN